MARILVIDDDEQFRLMIKEFLQRFGYHVVEARDGEEGIRLFDPSRTDLVITDVVMPNKEGLETIRELKQKAPGLKIIAVSGGGRLGPESYLTLAQKFGASRVFSKPFDLKEFLEAVQEVLSA